MKKPKNIIRTNINLPAELKKAVEEIAEKEHRSFNNFLEWVLAREVEKRKEGLI